MSEFSQEELKMLAEDFSPEEVEMIASTNALVDTIALLPDDVEKFIKEEFMPKVEENNENSFKALMDTAEKDPEFFKKLVSLDLIMSLDENENAVPEKQQDTVITRLSDEDFKKAESNFFKRFASLSAAEKKEFFNLVISLNEEQKKEMVNRLLNN